MKMLIIYLLAYLFIGFCISLLNTYMYSKIQTKEEAMKENPSILIAMIAWVLLWPLGIANTIHFRKIFLKMKQNENS